jgi:anti-sigma factor RsiW
MNCEKLENKWIAYLDGKASAAERREVEAHIAACGACAQRAAEYRALWGVLDELPPISPSASFDAAVRARVAAEAPAPLPVAAVTAETTQASSEADFRMINDLPELENYDVLTNFDALSDLPTTPAARPASHM